MLNTMARSTWDERTSTRHRYVTRYYRAPKKSSSQSITDKTRIVEIKTPRKSSSRRSLAKKTHFVFVHVRGQRTLLVESTCRTWWSLAVGHFRTVRCQLRNAPTSYVVAGYPPTLSRLERSASAFVSRGRESRRRSSRRVRSYVRRESSGSAQSPNLVDTRPT